MEKHHRGESGGHEEQSLPALSVRVKGGRAQQAQGWLVYKVMSGSGRGLPSLPVSVKGSEQWTSRSA